MTNTFHYTMSEADAQNIHVVVRSHCEALKNHIASNVESGNNDRALKLVKELRDYQRLFAAFNIEAKKEIAQATGNDIKTSICVV